MKMLNKTLLCVLAVAVVLNLALPKVMHMFATEEQITPPNGAAALPMWDQIMHMLVHHAQVPVSSSIIVALIVFLSVHLGGMLAHHL